MNTVKCLFFGFQDVWESILDPHRPYTHLFPKKKQPGIWEIPPFINVIVRKDLLLKFVRENLFGFFFFWTLKKLFSILKKKLFISIFDFHQFCFVSIQFRPFLRSQCSFFTTEPLSEEKLFFESQPKYPYLCAHFILTCIL